MKALNESFSNDIFVVSVYDIVSDNHYIPFDKFCSFSKNKFSYFFYILFHAFRYDVIVIGHINISIVGYLIKKMFPQKKVVLIAHGIEVWNELSYIKNKFISNVDYILSVSEYTKQILITKHKVSAQKIIVFPNTIDPNFTVPTAFEKPLELVAKYNITPQTKVLLTVSRMSRLEKYKGYEQVIKSLALVDKNIDYKYILVGKYDEVEYQTMYNLVVSLGLEQKVVFAGYIEDSELFKYYLLADIFVMPSKKEGFGIVFIEAAACGLIVIAGNKDGSVEALDHGNLGKLVDPDQIEEIAACINQSLNISQTAEDKIALQQKVIRKFGFEAYKNRLRTFIQNI